MSDHLLKVLSELVPNTTFYNGWQRSSLTGEQYRQGWKTMPEFELSSVRLVEQKNLDRVVETLKSLLAPFIIANEKGEDCVLTNIEAILAASRSFVTPLHDFAEAVLTSAVLITPPRTVELLRAWIDDEPLRCTTFKVLSGIVIEEDLMEAGPGVTLRRLPTDSDSLQKIGVPQRLAGAHAFLEGGKQWGPNVHGQPALCTEDTCAPAFYKGGLSQQRHPYLISPYPPFGEKWALALSLACDSTVGSTCEWVRFDDEVYSFKPWARCGSNGIRVWSQRRYRPSTRWPTLTKKMVEEGKSLGTNLYTNGLGNRVSTALGRWMNSKRGQGPNEFIDLRIAFELLYAPEASHGDISFRVQTRCARHLEQSLEKRKNLAKIVRNFYNTSSTYAHGRQMSASSKANKHREQLASAQQICRRALIQIIESEGCADPDVEALSLS